MCSNKRGAFWVLLFLLLALAVRMSWGQELESLPLSSETLTLSSYDTSELWALYFQTLTEQDEQLRMDRLNWQAFEQSMLASLESLQMQMLESQRTERRASLALQAARLALSDSVQSALNLKKEAKAAIDAAKGYKLEARIAEAMALLLALGLGAAVLF